MQFLAETRVRDRTELANQTLFGNAVYNPTSATLSDAAAVATANIAINFDGTPGAPPKNAELIGGLRMANVRGKIGRDVLEPRVFSTTPMFGNGNGPVNRTSENNLMFSPSVRQTKDMGTISTKSRSYTLATPLQASQVAEKNDARLWIEEANDASFTRIGADTRAKSQS